MNKINFAFFGSAYFSANFLERIINDEKLRDRLDLKFTATQPDRPSGRKQVITSTPVKQIANKYKIPVHDYELEIHKSKSGSSYGILTLGQIDQKLFSDLDFVLIYAYGAIISRDILALPKFGFWNIHPSLLPLYRGTAPMVIPLIKGDKTTGVTIIKMDDKMDHGPIIDQESYTIKKSDKRPDLEIKLTDMGFELFKSLIVKGIENIKPVKQDEKNATYTEKLKKSDGFIKFEEFKKNIIEAPGDLYNLYRGLYPWPGIWTILPNQKRLKITDIGLVENKLIINKVQLEGKREIEFEVFNKNYKYF